MVDEVWSIMQHPEGAAFMVSMAKRARKHRLGLQFITQDVQDLLVRGPLAHDHRPLRPGAAAERRVQAPACSRTRPPSRPWRTRSTCPRTCSAGWSPVPRGDGLLLAKGERFPIRIEATTEETELIEWRPGRH